MVWFIRLGSDEGVAAEIKIAMAAHVCVELDQINELPELINYLIQRNYRFSATKDHLSLCAGCNAEMRSAYTPHPAFPLNTCRIAHLTPAIPTSTPSSSPVECADLTQSKSANSEQNGDVNIETPPMDEDVDENDLMACGADLNQLSTNLLATTEKAELPLGYSPIIFIKKKGPGSAPKQCQATMHSMLSRFRPYGPRISSFGKVSFGPSNCEN
ncbi:hypothetical protein KIN20_013925 [Parelaphostrongylus tenuis]|uniref:Uncharacterized protein n=1 Tax=Parelaphostrongylus tenuis TaxID=148309 RepID=A0AAD5MCU9_PARTN|nr:hypothetical protein KIN20_013925 [Parelaphostrongylus tenuis]